MPDRNCSLDKTPLAHVHVFCSRILLNKRFSLKYRDTFSASVHSIHFTKLRAKPLRKSPVANWKLHRGKDELRMIFPSVSRTRRKSYEIPDTSDYVPCKNYCARSVGVEKPTNGMGRNNNQAKGHGKFNYKKLPNFHPRFVHGWPLPFIPPTS